MRRVHRFTVADVLRILRAALAETDEPELILSAIRDLRRSVDAIERRAVMACIQAGMTDTGIAEELGVSRQAVSQRWGHLRTLCGNENALSGNNAAGSGAVENER